MNLQAKKLLAMDLCALIIANYASYYKRTIAGADDMQINYLMDEVKSRLTGATAGTIVSSPPGLGNFILARLHAVEDETERAIGADLFEEIRAIVRYRLLPSRTTITPTGGGAGIITSHQSLPNQDAQPGAVRPATNPIPSAPPPVGMNHERPALEPANLSS
jgi:hypothetical protein